MPHPALTSDSVATITGGAAGIGLSAALQFAKLGMNVAIADIRADLLEPAKAQILAAGASGVLAQQVDVSDIKAVRAFEAEIAGKFGGSDILMNNAGIQPGSKMLGPTENWRRILEVNLWGVINGAQVFAPRMIERGRSGAIITSGSKQGITTPPGDPAYNVAKSAIKTFTEALAHELRNTQGAQISAHLLIPGFVYTELTRKGRSKKPDAAWTPDQTAEFMLAGLNNGDFYILCPDNDVNRETDEKRMAWAMGDIINNRPALSRWHPDYADDFAAYMNDS